MELVGANHENFDLASFHTDEGHRAKAEKGLAEAAEHFEKAAALWETQAAVQGLLALDYERAVSTKWNAGHQDEARDSLSTAEALYRSKGASLESRATALEELLQIRIAQRASPDEIRALQWRLETTHRQVMQAQSGADQLRDQKLRRPNIHLGPEA
jgi:hypothetical protein